MAFMAALSLSTENDRQGQQFVQQQKSPGDLKSQGFAFLIV